jgi:hypothetical protein
MTRLYLSIFSIVDVMRSEKLDKTVAVLHLYVQLR